MVLGHSPVVRPTALEVNASNTIETGALVSPASGISCHVYHSWATSDSPSEPRKPSGSPRGCLRSAARHTLHCRGRPPGLATARTPHGMAAAVRYSATAGPHRVRRNAKESAPGTALLRALRSSRTCPSLRTRLNGKLTDFLPALG